MLIKVLLILRDAAGSYPNGISIYFAAERSLILNPQIIATIYYKTEKTRGGHQKGSFDSAEFAKLMQDFERARKSPAKGHQPHYYVIYSVDDPTERKELCLFFNDVDHIERHD